MKIAVATLITATFLAGCSGEADRKPKAEASVEVHVGDQKSSLEKSLDNAGKEIKKGAEEAKDKLQDAGNAIKDKAQEVKDKLTDDKKAEVKVEVNK